MENQLDSYMAPPAQKSVTTEAMVSRQAQEVQAAMIIAKRFPRDEYAAYNRIMTACTRKNLAESSTYEFPRGREKVSGPSIRLAEVLAQNWGNIDFGVMELEQKAGESTAMSYAWDLETNVRQTKIFTVKHERKANGAIVKLTDPRDIYELVANQGARRVRACILGIIPGDIVDKAVEKCQQTLLGDTGEPLEDRLKVVLAAFDKEYKVTKEQIEDHFGYKITAFTEMDLLKLKKIGATIRDGMAKREDYFNFGKPEKETKSNVLDDFEKHLKETEGKGGAADADSNQGELSL